MNLPPNFHLCGPCFKPMSADYDPMALLKQKDERIFNFLEDARKKGEKVIYISIGSETYWSPWAIDAVKEGLKKLWE